jgi:hypothetical protein
LYLRLLEILEDGVTFTEIFELFTGVDSIHT